MIFENIHIRNIYVYTFLIVFIFTFLISIYNDKTKSKVEDYKKESVVVKEIVYRDEVSLENLESIHVKTPESVRALYMSGLGVSSEIIRNRLLKIIDTRNINSLVIDIKDNTGNITWESYYKDLKTFIDELHKKNIYVIGRVAVFQDNKYAELNTDDALKDESGNLWSNDGKSFWLDPSSTNVWKYNLDLAKRSYQDYGFDEINLDYIRYPGDGNLSDINYSKYDVEDKDFKRNNLINFYKYFNEEMDIYDIPVSASVFGYVTIVDYDFGIGQVLEDAVKYFDYVSPMIYPSHYYEGTLGYANPASYPYEIVNYSMSNAIKRTLDSSTSTDSIKVSAPSKFRPWIQDFNMGAIYDANMVRRQIDALNDLGIDSYMSWNAANRYNEEGY